MVRKSKFRPAPGFSWSVGVHSFTKELVCGHLWLKFGLTLRRLCLLFREWILAARIPGLPTGWFLENEVRGGELFLEFPFITIFVIGVWSDATYVRNTRYIIGSLCRMSRGTGSIELTCGVSVPPTPAILWLVCTMVFGEHVVVKIFF